jgi:hypothetical protein
MFHNQNLANNTQILNAADYLLDNNLFSDEFLIRLNKAIENNPEYYNNSENQDIFFEYPELIWETNNNGSFMKNALITGEKYFKKHLWFQILNGNETVFWSPGSHIHGKRPVDFPNESLPPFAKGNTNKNRRPLKQGDKGVMSWEAWKKKILYELSKRTKGSVTNYIFNGENITNDIIDHIIDQSYSNIQPQNIHDNTNANQSPPTGFLDDFDFENNFDHLNSLNQPEITEKTIQPVAAFQQGKKRKANTQKSENTLQVGVNKKLLSEELLDRLNTAVKNNPTYYENKKIFSEWPELILDYKGVLINGLYYAGRHIEWIQRMEGHIPVYWAPGTSIHGEPVSEIGTNQNCNVVSRRAWQANIRSKLKKRNNPLYIKNLLAGETDFNHTAQHHSIQHAAEKNKNQTVLPRIPYSTNFFPLPPDNNAAQKFSIPVARNHQQTTGKVNLSAGLPNQSIISTNNFFPSAIPLPNNYNYDNYNKKPVIEYVMLK